MDSTKNEDGGSGKRNSTGHASENQRNNRYDGGSDEETSRTSQNQRNNRYYTVQQTQRLEGFFNECAHPNMDARLQLSRELGLSPRQIKFWFQNKLTQLKVKQEKENSVALVTQNHTLRCEIKAMMETLRTMLCRSCGNSCLNEEDQLCLENDGLRKEIQKLWCEAEKRTGLPFSQLQALHESQLPSDGPSLDRGNPATPQKLPFGFVIMDLDKLIMADLANHAMIELHKLLRSDELWMNSDHNGRTVIDRKHYERDFPRAIKSPDVRTESSKHACIVSMDCLQLVDCFMNANKWKELFPTFVSKASTIEVIFDGNSQIGQLQLMYEELHLLSPLVEPRKFYFLRFCQKVEANLWAIVDVNYDIPLELSDSQSRVRRLPSGCYIQGMSDGHSKITWMEHTQIEDRRPIHEFYMEHIYGGLAFGAERRLAALKRMCERITVETDSSNSSFNIGGVNPSSHGKRSLMKLSQQMMSSFCDGLNPDGQQVVVYKMNDYEVHTTLKMCVNEGHPNSRVLIGATTTWLPFPPQKIFDFLTDGKSRPLWDVSNYTSVREVGRIASGYHSGNCISLLQAFSNSQKAQNNMLMLQESWIDPFGALVVYCPVPLPAINTVMSGYNPYIFPLSPSGFVISGKMSSGALVTVQLQIFESNATSNNISQSANAVSNFVGMTIDKLKAALN